MKFYDLIKEWLEFSNQNIKVKTYNTYLSMINGHIKDSIGELDLEGLTIKVLQNFINSIKKTCSNNTILLISSVINQSIDYGIMCGYMTVNNMKHIKLPKVETNEIIIFTDLELKKITDYCFKKKNKYFGILICLFTGIRIGELLALTYADIDYKSKILSIDKTISYIKINNKYQLVTSSPKTKNSKRKIPLPKIILNLLEKKDTSTPIISNKDGLFISPRQYQDTYKRLLKRLGIEYKSFHCLRHTFASYALKTGVDIKTLSLLLGHSNVSITLNRYCHASLEMKKNAIDKICNSLYNDKQKKAN